MEDSYTVEIRRKIKAILGWTAIGVGFCVAFALHALHPDMTQVRLLIAFWHYWVAVLALNYVGYMLMRK